MPDPFRLRSGQASPSSSTSATAEVLRSDPPVGCGRDSGSLRMTDALDSLFGLPIGWFHERPSGSGLIHILTGEDDPPDSSGVLPSSSSSCHRPTDSGVSASHRMNGGLNFPLVE